MSGRHRHDRHAGGGRAEGGRDPAEERPAGLEGEHHGERSEHRRPVEDDVHRVGARDLCHEGEEAVPERERVAGVEPPVGELVRRVEREVVEGEELLDAREVEEPVAADVPGDAPEEDPEGASEGQGEAPAADTVGSRPPTDREGKCRHPCREHEDERERERRGDDVRHRHRGEDHHEPPRHPRRDPGDAERPRDDEAGRQHDRQPEAELGEEEETAHLRCSGLTRR